MPRVHLTARENHLRAIELRHPTQVPLVLRLFGAIGEKYGEKLDELLLRHPLIPCEYIKDGRYTDAANPLYQQERYYRDDWGCVWHNVQGGLLGQVIAHPLEDWRALDAFRPPDPAEQFDWAALKEKTEWDRRMGLLTQGGGSSCAQGGFFDRLQFLRGLENLMLDFAMEPPQLSLLIEMLLEYNLKFIRRWLEIGVDQMSFHGDIGTQRGLLFSPATFRKHLKPAYYEMFQTCRKAGSHVYYSSDGRLLEIVPDLIECGVSLHDPQVSANTIAGIAQVYKGRLCAMVDIDEQMLPFCTPAEVREQMKEVVQEVGSPAGGLMIFACPSPDVQLENIEALCAAWEEFCANGNNLWC